MKTETVRWRATQKRLGTLVIEAWLGSPWPSTLAFHHREDRTPTPGYAATRETAMAAFMESWRRE